uniref:Uncharacterized protein n=1 Tax=Heterorhabditis bacteriophora TaxID=37862 RepID=A0A1I7WI67_HETBA
MTLQGNSWDKSPQRQTRHTLSKKETKQYERTILFFDI